MFICQSKNLSTGLLLQFNLLIERIYIATKNQICRCFSDHLNILFGSLRIKRILKMKFCQSTFIKSVIESVSMIKYIYKFEENSFDVLKGATDGPKTNLKGIYKFLFMI